MIDQHILRPHAEQVYAHELKALAVNDDRQRPENWLLSPWAVVTYLLGGKLPDGTEKAKILWPAPPHRNSRSHAGH